MPFLITFFLYGYLMFRIVAAPPAPTLPPFPEVIMTITIPPQTPEPVYPYCELDLSLGTVDKSLEYERIPIVYSRFSNSTADYSWFERLDEKVYKPLKYDMSYEPCNATDSRCIFPNKGKEVPSYLKFIVDHYADLPEYVIFLHGHNQSWHSFDKIPVLKRITIETLRANNVLFWSFRNITSPLVPEKLPAVKPAIMDGWGALYKGLEGFPDKPPVWWTYNCCAEFIVSRAAIRSRPLEFYVKAWDWLWKTQWNDYLTSRFFEYTWHMVFTWQLNVTCDGYFAYNLTLKQGSPFTSVMETTTKSIPRQLNPHLNETLTNGTEGRIAMHLRSVD